MTKTKPSLVMQEALERLAAEPDKDYWLAAVGFIQLLRQETLPEPVQKDVDELLLKLLVEVMEKALEGKVKANTFLRHERYLNEMQELIFLTGTNPEDAAGRIVNFHILRKDSKVPTQDSMLTLWNNRSKKHKETLTVDSLIYGSYELAVEHTNFIRSKECAPTLPPKMIEVKKEHKELFDNMAPRTDDSEVKEFFASLAPKPEYHPILKLFASMTPNSDYPKLISIFNPKLESIFKKHFPDF